MTGIVAAPSLGGAYRIVGSNVAVYCAGNQEEHTSPSLGALAVVNGRQDNLVLSTVGVVVGHEQQLIGIVRALGGIAQLVARGHHLVGIALG